MSPPPLPLDSLASELDGASKALLAAQMVRRGLDDQAVLIAQGAPGEDLWLVVSGSLEVWVGDGAAAVLVATVLPGGFVGEMSLLDPGPASATVRAKGATEVAGLGHGQLRTLRDTRPDIARVVLMRLCVTLAGRLRHTSAGVLAATEGGMAVVQPAGDAGLFGRMLKRIFGQGGAA